MQWTWGYGYVWVYNGADTGVLSGPIPDSMPAPGTTPIGCIGVFSWNWSEPQAFGCDKITPDAFIADPLLNTAKVNFSVPANIQGTGTLTTSATITGVGPYVLTEPLASLINEPPPPPPLEVSADGYVMLERDATATGTIFSTTGIGGSFTASTWAHLGDEAYGFVDIVAP